MKNFLNILYWFIIAFALIQFIPIDRTNKPVKASEDFVKIYHSPPKIHQMLKNACYDCHSNETVYPNYAYVAPVSWSIKNHVNKGRKFLNFSEWGTFDPYLKKSMLEKSVRSIKDYSMPMPGYIARHPKANLTKAERIILQNYFENILKTGNYE